MAETVKSDENSARRGRSPSFPFIPLEAAVSRLKGLEAKFGRHPIPVRKAGLAWKMKEGSSQTFQTLAALKSFGFLKYEGSKDDRKALLTDDARTYLLAQQEHIKKDIIRKAALKPKEIAKYWAEWKTDPPPDEVRLDELGLKANYTKEGAKAFLKVYDDTIAYAGLSISDNIEADGEGEEDNEELSPPLNQRRLKKRGKKPGMKEDVFTLDEGDVVFQWPERLSQESYEDLEAWAKLIMRKIQRSVGKDTDEATFESDEATE